MKKQQYVKPQMETIKIGVILLQTGSFGDPATEPAYSHEDEIDFSQSSF